MEPNYRKQLLEKYDLLEKKIGDSASEKKLRS
jgi:hypothetical protein